MNVQTANGEEDWDLMGQLSIVVQGGVFQGNIAETANICRHWRELFPNAEIVLSLSSTDILDGEIANGRLLNPRIVAQFQRDSTLRAALRVINGSCDLIGMAEDALPLPPIKSDSPKLNNMNLQIAAARRGLELASGKYVLRIRNDLFFQNRNFLHQYEASSLQPRLDAAVFKSRVLISWMFTLNPYTIERLPLHFSDWFHFGLTEDVRRIWKSPYISLKDATHFATAKHPRGSSNAERLFNTRIAVEQHLMLHTFNGTDGAAMLSHHNDHSACDQSIDILLDNFVLCDLSGTGCVFEKYAAEMSDHKWTRHCLTPEDWQSMVQSRDVDYRETLKDKIAEAIDPLGYQREPAFPLELRPSQLFTRDGKLIGDELVATSQDGVLSYGPHIAIRPGKYVAEVDMSSLLGPGTLTLKACLNQGKKVISVVRANIDVESEARVLELPFEIQTSTANDLEIVCEMSKLRGAALSSIRIRKDDGAFAAFPRRYTADLLSLGDSRFNAGRIHGTKSSGLLFHGPYTSLPGGGYRARVDASELTGSGSLKLRATASAGQKLLAEKRFNFGSLEPSTPQDLSLSFIVPRAGAENFEIVCHFEDIGEASVSGITIEKDDIAEIRRRTPLLRRLKMALFR